MDTCKYCEKNIIKSESVVNLSETAINLISGTSAVCTILGFIVATICLSVFHYFYK